MTGPTPTRRRVLRYGAALDVGGAATTLVPTATANPGDGDWNGGKWTHFSAEVTDIDAFDADAPLTNADDVLDKSHVEIGLGSPDFGGPPDSSICPLSGRA